MEFAAKTFEELSSLELYEILKARSAIFIVEQNCVYQDLDDLDYRSLHIFSMEDQKVTSYLRAYWKNRDVVQIGRVLTMKHGTGLGGELLKAGISIVKEKMPCRKIYIEAQCYAEGFYKREGFQVISDPFLEDGIPHEKMELEIVPEIPEEQQQTE
jgi:ElaA protein